MADKYTFKDVHRLYYWCNKVLPTVYDDSLSYYELLNKIALKLNTLIENYNELPEYIVQEIAEMLQSEELGAILQGVISNFMLNVKYPPAGITPAVGDGAADDTEAIQGCIDWAAENGGGAVYIPAGWYLTQSITLKENVSLIGYDRYATVFTLKGGATEPLVTAQGANTIAGITLNANTAVQTEYQNALTLVGEDHLIKDVILDGGNYGLESTSTGHLQINDVIVPGCVIAGLYLHGSAQVQAENVMVENVSEIAGDASYIINNNNGTYQIGTIARVDEGVVLNGNGNYVQLRVENATTKVTDNGTNNQYLIETEGDSVTNAALAELTQDLEDEEQARTDADTALDTRLTGLVTAEETARTTADEALGTRIDTEITQRTDADGVLENSINAEVTNRTNADTALQANIDNLADNLDVVIDHQRIKNHFRYYINNATGNDENDGLSEQTAFKTLDRFLKETDRYAEVRGYITSSGTYHVTYGNVYANCNIHITARTANVTLDFLSEDSEDYAVYMSHWNLQGLDDSAHMAVTAHKENGDLADLYFDNCMLTFNRVDFNTIFRMYGGTLVCSRCSLIGCNIVGAIFSFSDGIRITNTSPTPRLSPLSFINSYGRLIGGWQAEELTASGATFCYINSSVVFIGSVIVPNMDTKYNYGLQVNPGSVVRISQSRLNNIASRTVNGNTFDVNSVIITDGGIMAPELVRYHSGALQYWNGTAWTNIS